MDRNLILTIALSITVLLVWEMFVAGPQREAVQTARQETARQEQTLRADETGDTANLGVVPADRAGLAGVGIEDALATAPRRIPVNTPSLTGSINLAGGRIDDISLRNYRETVDPESPMIRLLSPRETEHGHYIQQGWLASDGAAEAAVWEAPTGAELTPDTPVTLTRRQGGLVFEKTFSVDDEFMFTVTQTVRNEGAETQSLTPYGLVIQRGVPNDLQNFIILHEGPIAVVDKSLYERKYDKAKTAVVDTRGERGWVGVTNKYWLAAAIPPQGETFNADMRNVGTQNAPIFRASYALAPRTLASGEETSLTSHLFAGAKVVDILQAYEKPVEEGGLGIWDFDRAVDWGNFWFLTRPIFFVLNLFGDMTGNFGVAILFLTLVIKLLLFPLANKAYDSMSKMKKLQPEIEKLRKRYTDDKVKLQQEMMALYQKEKMNPLAGCLPILIQMPIFYALYKTLFVTIELRHEPFIFWLKDLSAPDPTTIFNLFGLLPYDPTAIPLIGAFLGIGVLPLLMGVGMWLQMKLNPPPPDPVQAQIFALLPIIFTFLFATFAAGLVLYWFWNTVLSILQQWYIMKRNGVSVDWAANMKLPWATKKNAPADGK